MSKIIFDTKGEYDFPFRAFVDDELECVGGSGEDVRARLKMKAECMMRKWYDVHMQLDCGVRS